jgi:hypothetical protein
MMTAAVAALRLGLLDGLLERIAPGFVPPAAFDQPPSLGALAARGAGPSADSLARPAPDTSAHQPVEQAAASSQEASQPVARAAEAAPEPVSSAPIAKFRVLSVPSGAFVSIDGKAAGRTPIEVEYAAGTELSVFSKARGFLARRERVVVQADQAPLKLVLSALPYVVDVASDPPGAKVTAAGRVEGLTPTTVKLDSLTGARKIVISKDGFKTVTQSLTRGSFTEEPRRMVAKISVSLEPQGASEVAVAAEANDTGEETADVCEPGHAARSFRDHPER